MNNNSNGITTIIGVAAVASVGLLGFGLMGTNKTTPTNTTETTKTQYSTVTPKTPEKKESEEECKIKGNINSKGVKIYHMPGQQYYDETIITPSKGEKWFCTEQEAIAAGWRKSKV